MRPFAKTLGDVAPIRVESKRDHGVQIAKTPAHQVVINLITSDKDQDGALTVQNCADYCLTWGTNPSPRAMTVRFKRTPTRSTFNAAIKDVAKIVSELSHKTRNVIFAMDNLSVYSLGKYKKTELSHVALIEDIADVFSQQYYNYDDLRNNRKPKHRVVLTFDGIFKASAERIQRVVKAKLQARFLTDLPQDICTPLFLADRAKSFEKRRQVGVDVLTGNSLQLSVPGLHHVGRGGKNPPCLIKMEVNAKNTKSPPICLVFKGITWDGGGFNPKSAQSFIEAMHIDMAMAGAGLEALAAYAANGGKKRVIAYFMCAENLLDKNAYRPGDVIILSDGTKLEIRNADGEGRIILSDGVRYAVKSNTVKPKAKKSKPVKPQNPFQYIATFGTITSNSYTALGAKRVAFYTNDEALEKLANEASLLSGEQIWQMPLSNDYLQLLKPTVSRKSDFMNVPQTPAADSACAAALIYSGVPEGQPYIGFDCAGDIITNLCGTGLMTRYIYHMLKNS